MSLWEAIVLGIIQGLTEFIPISSTAHLRVIPALLGWSDPGAAFTAVIQIGTLVAALVYFREDIRRLTTAVLSALWAGRPLGTPDAKLGWMIAVGTVPIVVCGVAFQKWIKHELRSLYVIAAAAIGLALLLLAAELFVARNRRLHHQQRGMAELGWWDAILVGLAQAAALVPGASRSGVTITSGLFLGMNRYTAARFSFLLSLPSIFAAGIYELYKDRHELLTTQQNAVSLLAATAVSAIVGYVSIAFLLGYLKRYTTAAFIAYRLVLGGFILLMLWQENLHP